jgi:hypothetical protein
MEYRIDSHVKAPRPKVSKRVKGINAAVRNAYNKYAEAYKAVYGVMPTGFTYDTATGFIHVGNSGGVTVKRLTELTRQLINRAG